MPPPPARRCLVRFIRPRATTGTAASNRQGTSRIDGLERVMTSGDGTVDRRILVTDPTNPNAAVWPDGVGYPRRRR